MAGGSRKSNKELLHKFKSKVIAKLFNTNDSTNTVIVPSDDSEVSSDNEASHSSSSTTLSGLDLDFRPREVRMYGSQCCPTGSRHQKHVNEPVLMVGSSSYLGDDEDSEGIFATRKRKRKKTRVCSKILQQAQLPASSSNNSQQNQQSTSANTLSKNQKRKLKKKKREHEKKINACQPTEFFVDSSSNNNAVLLKSLSSISKEEHLKTVKEFFEAIWEIYTNLQTVKDYSCSEFDSLLLHLEHCEADELLLLFKIMSALVLCNQEIGLRKIEEFKEQTSLQLKPKKFIAYLFTYWTTQVMKS